MKTTMITLTLLIVQTAAQAQYNASWNEVLSQQPLVRLSQDQQLPMVNRHTEAVQFHYALDPQQKIADKIPAHTDESRQYWLDTTAEQLQAGIDLPLSGKTAYVRISPLNAGTRVQLNPAQLQLQASAGEVRISSFVDADQMNRAGASFSDQTLAFKVDTAAAGTVRLAVPDLSASSEAYVVNVLEPDSPHVLKLSMDHHSYASGKTAQVFASMTSDQKNQPANLQGYVRSADGRVYAQLHFTARKEGGYVAEVPLTQGQSLASGLWDIHTIAESQSNGVRVVRDAQSSFAVHLNTARFNGTLQAGKHDLAVGITVAEPGRYEIRGVLMGTDQQGQLRPLAMLMSARWLQPGDQSVTFDLSPLTQRNAAFSAPFMIRQLQLTDQSRLAPAQMVNSGISLTPLTK